MVLKKEDIEYVKTIADRERAPMYVVGETTGDHRFVFEQKDGVKPIDLAMSDMFGSSPKTTLVDNTVVNTYKDAPYNENDIEKYVADTRARGSGFQGLAHQQGGPLRNRQDSPPAVSG